MATTKAGDFSVWLNEKLRNLNTDEGVFGSYIVGILEGDESRDEKEEALEGILTEIIENDINHVINEIIDHWQKCSPIVNDVSISNPVDVDAQLAKLLENKHIATTTQRQYTAEELNIREKILSQYSQVELNDDDDPVNEPVSAVTSDADPILQKNTNALDVAQAAKERREQARIDSKAKKDKDKEDREKQKQLREEKKEKRKTVKGERRR